MAKLTVTHQQGNQILQYLAQGIAFPEKLGKEEFDVAQRSFANDEMLMARRALLSYSGMYAKNRKVLFGEASNWRLKDEVRERWNLIDLELPITLNLNDEQERGIYWILLLMCHPASPIAVGITVLDDVVWPIAEALGLRNDLREMCGLNQRKLPRLPKKDTDPSWKKDAKKVELLDEKPTASPVEPAKVAAEEIAKA